MAGHPAVYFCACLLSECAYIYSFAVMALSRRSLSLHFVPVCSVSACLFGVSACVRACMCGVMA